MTISEEEALQILAGFDKPPEEKTPAEKLADTLRKKNISFHRMNGDLIRGATLSNTELTVPELVTLGVNAWNIKLDEPSNSLVIEGGPSAVQPLLDTLKKLKEDDPSLPGAPIDARGRGVRGR